jgi:septin family protein
MRSLLPFGVVGSNTTLTDDEGTKYKGREYPWGMVNIEDQVSQTLYDQPSPVIHTEPL